MNKRSQIVFLPGNGFEALHLFFAYLRTSCPLQVTLRFSLSEMHRLTAFRKWGSVCVAKRCQVVRVSYRVTKMQTPDTVGLWGEGWWWWWWRGLLWECEISSAMVEGGRWVGGWEFLSRGCRRWREGVYDDENGCNSFAKWALKGCNRTPHSIWWLTPGWQDPATLVYLS